MGTVLSIIGNSIPRSNLEFESFLHHYFDVNASLGAEPIYGMSTTSMGEVEHHSNAAGYDHWEKVGLSNHPQTIRNE